MDKSIYSNNPKTADRLNELLNSLRNKYTFMEPEVLTHIAAGKYYRASGDNPLSIAEFRKAREKCTHNTSEWFKNWMLNEIEISEHKIHLESKPRRINVTLTNRCNISCIMCECPGTSWDLSHKTLNELKDLFPYLQNIVWLGGEVFLHPGFKEIIEEAARYKHIKHDICTNGLLLDEKWLQLLDNINTYLTVSIDGFTKDIYEYIRKGADYDMLIRKLELLRDHTKTNDKNNHRGFNIGLQMVIMKENYHEIEKAHDFLIKYNFSNFSMVPLFDYMRDSNSIYNDNLIMNHITESIKILKERTAGSSIRIIPEIPIHDCLDLSRADSISSNAKTTDNVLNQHYNGSLLCLWPWQVLTINQHDAASIHCYCGHATFGNTKEQSLMELWNCTDIQSFRKNIIENNTADSCSDACNSGKMSREALRFD
ncbi:radical SAM protein [Elusimicrobiota bacterium]